MIASTVTSTDSTATLLSKWDINFHRFVYDNENDVTSSSVQLGKIVLSDKFNEVERKTVIYISYNIFFNLAFFFFYLLIFLEGVIHILRKVT